MKPLIFDIKRYAINDGPGIRTTLFIKGCPLRCVWCHNPESWTPEPQVLYKQSKCIGCGSCVAACPQQSLELTPHGIRLTGRCSLCGETQPALAKGMCTEACPTTALELCGHEYDMDELMGEVEKERDIMEDSGGGVTLCGGEPLMHPEYTLELLRELGRRGFHRTVDTTLYAAPDVVEAVAKECELLLVDLKLMDSEKHRLYTGVPNELILDNIRRVARGCYNFVIRIPLIEGINADDENIEQTARFLATLTPPRPHPNPLSKGRGEQGREGAPSPLTVHLLPYHDVGRDKHRRMWCTFNPEGFSMSVPSDEKLKHCKALLEAHGLHVVIGG